MPLRAPHALAAAALLVAGALVLRSALGVADGLDYFTDAAFPIDALARGDLRGFAANPALMGDFSLFLRAPFVWLVFDQDVSVVYLAGCRASRRSSRSPCTCAGGCSRAVFRSAPRCSWPCSPC
jgi:hypothetical protein